jgi:DNA-binding PadR family transcriptional regulator
MLTSVEAMTLAALADRARYGYDLSQRIRELTNGRVDIKPGNLYRVLDRLVTDGLVRETTAPATSEDERRRYFALTSRGVQAVAEELRMYATVLRRVPQLREVATHG